MMIENTKFIECLHPIHLFVNLEMNRIHIEYSR